MTNNDSEKLIAFWTSHLNKQRSSGLSCAEYCRINELVNHQMIYWKGRLTVLKRKNQNRNQRESPVVESQFAKAEMMDQNPRAEVKSPTHLPTRPQTVSLKLSDGFVIELNNSVDPCWVATLITSLRRV